MLRRIVRYVFWAAAIAWPFSPAISRDYFSKGWWDKPDDYQIQYKKAIERRLPQAFKRNVVLRTVFLPPFDPEGIVGIVRSPAGYHAFNLEASLQIWDALHERKENLPKIRAIYKEKPITSALALRIAALWRAVLSDPRNYGTEKGVIQVDAAQFILSVALDPGERLTASTVNFNDGTKAWELIQVGDAMYKYILGKGSYVALERRIAQAEKKIGVRSSTKAVP